MPFLQDPNGLQLVDAVLTNLALRYRPEMLGYDKLVSYMDVSKNHGIYPVWTQADLWRNDVDPEVSDRAETPEIDFGYSTKPYALSNKRLKITLTPEELDQAHSALRFRETKTEALLDRMALAREVRLANALLDTSNGGQLTGGVATPSVLWDAGTSGTPATIEKDIKTARKAVYDATGQMLDTIVIPWNVAGAIAIDPSIRTILQYTVNGQQILRDGEAILPAQLWGLDVVIVGSKVNNAREGVAVSLGDVWGKSVRLLKRTPTNNWGAPATVYALRGNVMDNPAASGLTAPNGEPQFSLVDHWYTPDPPVEHIRAWQKIQELVVAPSLGYELHNVIS